MCVHIFLTVKCSLHTSLTCSGGNMLFIFVITFGIKNCQILTKVNRSKLVSVIFNIYLTGPIICNTWRCWCKGANFPYEKWKVNLHFLILFCDIQKTEESGLQNLNFKFSYYSVFNLTIVNRRIFHKKYMLSRKK